MIWPYAALMTVSAAAALLTLREMLRLRAEWLRESDRPDRILDALRWLRRVVLRRPHGWVATDVGLEYYRRGHWRGWVRESHRPHKWQATWHRANPSSHPLMSDHYDTEAEARAAVELYTDP
jgi:hypothetical protein